MFALFDVDFSSYEQKMGSLGKSALTKAHSINSKFNKFLSNNIHISALNIHMLRYEFAELFCFITELMKINIFSNTEKLLLENKNCFSLFLFLFIQNCCLISELSTWRISVPFLWTNFVLLHINIFSFVSDPLKEYIEKYFKMNFLSYIILLIKQFQKQFLRFCNYMSLNDGFHFHCKKFLLYEIWTLKC